MIISSTKTIGLIGNVFDPVQGETLKTLIIANGKIARVMDGRQPLTDIPGIAIITLDENMTIFPGLINLHTHWLKFTRLAPVSWPRKYKNSLLDLY